MQHQTGQLEGSRHLTLAWQAWVPDRDVRAAVLVAHGLAEHGGRYVHVGGHLAAAGYAVYAIDHRGHGRSQGDRAQVDRLATVVEDLHTFAELVRSVQPGKPLFLLGHSLGGAVAAAYAVGYPEELAGLVLSAPAVAVEGTTPLQVRMGKVLSVLSPGLRLLALDGTAVSRDSEVVQAYDEDPLNYRGKIPVRTLAELVRLSEWLPEALASLRLPILLLHGTADRLVPVRASHLVHDCVSSTDRTLRLYDGLYHEVFNEPERERVLADVTGWLEEHL